ncbi:MAG: preprotein translocase subunit YajC [Clostridia bacterium]|nr:preprotein translocase subunit YajC [Clostridia bacterium]
MDFILTTNNALGAGGSSTSMILIMVGMFALMYFLTIRPQKKRQKEEEAMRNAVDVGDEITTIGGICGRVVTVKENNLIIETGSDRNKMQITKWAVQMNNTANERLAAERAAAKEAAEKAKAEKKNKKSSKED